MKLKREFQAELSKKETFFTKKMLVGSNGFEANGVIRLLTYHGLMTNIEKSDWIVEWSNMSHVS